MSQVQLRNTVIDGVVYVNLGDLLDGILQVAEKTITVGEHLAPNDKAVAGIQAGALVELGKTLEAVQTKMLDEAARTV